MHRRDGQLIVSATDLVGFLACGHLTELERAAAAGLIEKPVRDDPEVELLQRRGAEHEQRYIANLAAEGRHVTALDGDTARSYAERAAETVEAMRRGDDVIYQATVFDGRWVGHPDFLLRVGERGLLGVSHHYEVADTKLAHSAKASALIQICSYVEQVSALQGNVTPERVYVVSGGAEIGTHAFRTAEMMAYYRRAKASFEQAVDDAAAGEPAWPIERARSYPDPVEHCAVCRWFVEHCRRQWRDDDALPLVAGITRRQRQALAAGAVSTMHGLADLTRPLPLVDLKRQQLDSLWRVREQARLQVASAGLDVPVHELLEPERDSAGSVVPDRGLAALPAPADGDLFFDIEGDPFAYWDGLDYLFGLWADGQYRAVWATERAAEKAAFERVMDLFIERLDRYPDMHVYHYAPYEPTALKRLAGRHGTREAEVDRLLRGRVLVDLYRVVRQGVRVGAERYSIKNLEPLYGFRREIDLRSAGDSIVEFEQWLETGRRDQRLLDEIEAYNRDDCVSTERLRDWLELQRVAAAARFGALPRPPQGDQQLSVDQTEREQAVADLERRLEGPAPLLGHLVDWHRRENKATWWRFYDLLTKSDDELLDEREPIAGLEYVGIVADGGTRQSDDHRYRFPAQEHSVDAGKEVHDPQLVGGRTKTGKVQAIDKDAGTLDIRRSRDWQGQHPTAIVPLDVYGAQAQQQALMRIGAWVAEHGLDSAGFEYRAARDLLRREPPRFSGAGQGDLVRGDETGTLAARRLVTSLDGTTLAIQGPPGSGKTYTGARMIVDLVRSGRRVGITANSHKVIGNLLAEVCAAAAEAALPLRALQRCERDEVVQHPLVKRAAGNDDVERALAENEADVVGGTPWLWARGELAGTLDTLFVDEAGQMSLANVVAISGAARNVVLLGDPQQLDQPTQGVHPPGAGGSALGHYLGGLETVPPDRGVFLEKTWRMHPAITRYTSELFYEGKLDSIEGLERQRVLGQGWLAGSGLRWLPVEHDGRTNASPEEAAAVAAVVAELRTRDWVDREGSTRRLDWQDIVIVSPFNAHRLLIQERLGHAARVGTVDKFQGQQAAVSIYTMATSRPEDAPRGVSFLYSLNRLNVATTRARVRHRRRLAGAAGCRAALA